MDSKLLRVARFGLLASVATIGVQSYARAATATLTDNYYGGVNSYNNADVIGTSVFDTTSATVNLTTTNLTVTINTNFAGAPGTPQADGTTYGSLFIGSSATWNSDHASQSAPYANDQYTPGEWTYAVVANGTANGSADGLYAITGAETAHNYAGSGVTDYYTTSSGNVVMSNVNNNPISANNPGNPGFYFRQGQAVGFSPTGSALYSGSLGVADGTSVTYSLNIDAALYDALRNGFALSWAMTCANDVIQGVLDFPGGNAGPPAPTPLPAGLSLFAGGLGLLGFVGSRRRKRTVKATFAA